MKLEGQKEGVLDFFIQYNNKILTIDLDNGKKVAQLKLLIGENDLYKLCEKIYNEDVLPFK